MLYENPFVKSKFMCKTLCKICFVGSMVWNLTGNLTKINFFLKKKSLRRFLLGWGVTVNRDP